MSAFAAAARALAERLSRSSGRSAENISKVQLSPEELESINNSSLVIRRRRLDDLLGMKGKLETLYDMNVKSLGPLQSYQLEADKRFRDSAERKLFGSKGQSYGYLSSDPMLHFLEPMMFGGSRARGVTHLEPMSRIGGYGRFGVELRPEAKDLSTYTLGDSLMDDVIPKTFGGSGPLTEMEVRTLNHSGLQDMLGLAKMYAEFQTHAPVTKDLVKRIIDYGVEPDLAAERKARRAGIEYVSLPERSTARASMAERPSDLYEQLMAIRKYQRQSGLLEGLEEQYKGKPLLPFKGNYARGGLAQLRKR